MANSAQARKRARQEESRRQNNVAVASRYRTHVKNVRKKIDAGDADGARTAFAAAVPVIDSAVTRGLIHRNHAARQKSRLNAQIRKL